MSYTVLISKFKRQFFRLNRHWLLYKNIFVQASDIVQNSFLDYSINRNAFIMILGSWTVTAVTATIAMSKNILVYDLVSYASVHMSSIYSITDIIRKC